MYHGGIDLHMISNIITYAFKKINIRQMSIVKVPLQA